jgi:hypothetical protein
MGTVKLYSFNRNRLRKSVLAYKSLEDEHDDPVTEHCTWWYQADQAAGVGDTELDTKSLTP